MPTLPFGEYRPDLSDLDGTHSRSLANVIPRGDGYGPIKDIAALTSALPAACRGYFYARATDGSVVVFAGTATKLYQLNNTFFTWEDVSAGAGTYTTLSADANWSFAQFSNRVIACQANDDVQSFVLGSSSEFADLGGSPPDAAYVAVVGQFVVLSGLTANPFRVHWCSIGDPTAWTAGTNQSDFQDLPDGGIVRQTLGGELGVIFQDLAIRRMVYSPGSEVIFVIERIAKDIGLLHPYAATAVGEKIFFLTPKGFMMSDPAGGMLPIGAEKVDRTFLESYDASAPQLVVCAADPKSHLVIWTYRTAGMSSDVFDSALAYNWLLQRWVPISVSGEYMASLAQPGVTIEGLDAIAPGALEITGLADNGSGEIRVTVASTSGLTTGDYKTISGVTGSFEDDVNDTWPITVVDGTNFDLDGSSVDSQNVTGTADNGSGLIRLTVASTAAWSTGDKVVVASVGGTTEANGDWVVTVVDATHLDLDGSTFANAWTSGGTVKDRYDSATDGGVVGGSTDLMETSWDAIGTATLPSLSVANSSHKLAFFNGDNLEATLETPEQSGDGRRIQVNGFWPITDAATVYGRISKRQSLQAAITYTNESTMNDDGFVPLIRSTRYSRAKIRIPAAEVWTYASGVRPLAQEDGEI